MANYTWGQSMEKVINKLENIQDEQLEVNKAYDEFCKCTQNEMDKYLNDKSQCNTS